MSTPASETVTHNNDINISARDSASATNVTVVGAQSSTSFGSSRVSPVPSTNQAAASQAVAVSHANVVAPQNCAPPRLVKVVPPSTAVCHTSATGPAYNCLPSVFLLLLLLLLIFKPQASETICLL